MRKGSAFIISEELKFQIYCLNIGIEEAWHLDKKNWMFTAFR
jgi:hypothetical protein